jgi:hypothetical protein
MNLKFKRVEYRPFQYGYEATHGDLKVKIHEPVRGHYAKEWSVEMFDSGHLMVGVIIRGLPSAKAAGEGLIRAYKAGKHQGAANPYC